jgi:hypothetical protein
MYHILWHHYYNHPYRLVLDLEPKNASLHFCKVRFARYLRNYAYMFIAPSHYDSLIHSGLPWELILRQVHRVSSNERQYIIQQAPITPQIVSNHNITPKLIGLALDP